MANLKRYTMVVRRDENGFATPALKVRQKGDVVKFEDIKEFLSSASNNKQSAKVPGFEECFEGVCRTNGISDNNTAFDGAQMMYNFVAGKIAHL